MRKKLLILTSVVALVLSGTQAIGAEGWAWSKLNPFGSSERSQRPPERTAMVDGSPLIGALSKPADMGATAVRRVQRGTGRVIGGASSVLPWNWGDDSDQRTPAPWTLGSHPSKRSTSESSSWFSWFTPQRLDDGPKTPKEFLSQDRPNWGE